MNTEQLKTAEEILNEKRSDWTYEARNDEHPVSTQLILDAMNSFASQESKRAVDEFKEKLKVDIKYMRNRTFKQDGMPVGENEDFVRGCDDIIDLIDKL